MPRASPPGRSRPTQRDLWRRGLSGHHQPDHRRRERRGHRVAEPSLDPLYPVIFIDAIVVKIRDGSVANRPIYVAMAVTMDGERDVWGLWWGREVRGQALVERAHRDQEPGRERRADRLLRRLERPARVGPPPSGRRPTSRPASSTWCATRCATPPALTGRRSPPTFGPSTPPRRSTPPLSDSVSSKRNGGPSTRPSSRSGGRLGGVHSVPLLPGRDPLDDLHNQCHRVAERPVPPIDPDPGHFPTEASAVKSSTSPSSREIPEEQRRQACEKLEASAQHTRASLRQSHQQ